MSWSVSKSGVFAGDVLNTGSIFASNGDTFLDVSWIPENNPDGQFVCRKLENGNKIPTEYFETTDREEAYDWFHKRAI